MTNPEIVAYVQGIPNASAAERELAERLLAAMEEIDTLTREVQGLIHKTVGGDSGNDTGG